MYVDAFLEGNWGPVKSVGSGINSERLEPLPSLSGFQLLICTMQLPRAALHGSLGGNE